MHFVRGILFFVSFFTVILGGRVCIFSYYGILCDACDGMEMVISLLSCSTTSFLCCLHGKLHNDIGYFHQFGYWAGLSCYGKFLVAPLILIFDNCFIRLTSHLCLRPNVVMVRITGDQGFAILPHSCCITWYLQLLKVKLGHISKYNGIYFG